MNQANKSEIDENKQAAVWPIDHLVNVGHSLTETAERMPNAVAVAAPISNSSRASNEIEYETITFAELESRSNQIAHGLIGMGVAKGTRIALMVPPGIEFVAQVFGLFKAGVVVILIDPGMGRKNMIRCLSEAAPEGMVGIAKAHMARLLYKFKFRKCKYNVVVGKNFFPGCKSSIRFASHPTELAPLDMTREDEAAIIFTTGSTGPPKGVLYRHRTFLEQAEQIRDYFSIMPGTTDVSGFPLFALFNTAMGTTTVFPDMDPTRPAEVHPPNIISAVEKFNANQSFGSPALWNTVSNFCVKHNVKLPQLTRILTAGAPVPPTVLKRVLKIISPTGDAFTPYGATESLPVACISATQVLNETGSKTDLGAGVCVGHRFPKMSWKVIRITDEPLADFSNVEELPNGEIGELIVQGVVVTDKYVTQTDANALHKIKEGNSFWHRMGDVGYLDQQDRFWMCGRKGHRVETAEGTMFTIPVEAIINTHPSVYRSALVGIGTPGKLKPVLVVEQDKDNRAESLDDLYRELRLLASENEITKPIRAILFKDSLPVDIRHNSKIFREQLRGWAASKLGHH